MTGGWYDAGDHGKYVTSGALPAWQLLATVSCSRRHGADSAEESAIERSAAGSSIGCCECNCPTATRTRDWLSIAYTAAPGNPRRSGRTSMRPPGCCTGPPPAPRSPWPRWPRRPPGSSPSLTRLRHNPAQRRHPRLPAAHHQPRLVAPDDQGRFGGDPYFDDDLDDDFYWVAAESGWPPARNPTFQDLRESALHQAEVFDLTASTSTGSPPRPASTSL